MTSAFYEQNGYISVLINSLPGVEDMSYLELGLQRGVNFESIKCKHKVSVDVDPQWNPTYVMSTDQYFEEHKEVFDLIFIDACHSFRQVRKDFYNAVGRCNRFIFIHDLYPDCEEWTAESASGDAYRFLYYLVCYKVCPVYALDTDCGLSVVRLPIIQSPLSDMCLQDPYTIMYKEFVEMMSGWKRYSVEEMIQLLKDLS